MARRGGAWRYVGLAGALAGLAVTGGVRATGRRVRSQRDPERDDPLAPPEDLVHHRLPTFDGGELHVVDTGPPGSRPDAPAVLLLHGVTLQWWVWSAAIRLLRGRYRVLAWDMRGHGASQAGSKGVTLEAAARDIETILLELDLRGVILVGHSMGGMTVGRLVADHHGLAHERCAALVFVATSAAPLSQAAVVGGLAGLAGVAGRLAGHAVGRPRFSYPWHEGDLSAALISVAFGRSPTARMIEDVRVMEEAMSPERMAEAAGAIATHDVRAELRRVDLPAEILVGTHDKLTPPVHARELRELIGGANLVVLDGIGHQVMQERPEAVLAAVDRAAARADDVRGRGSASA